MESPVRKMQKRNDYNRHKLFRKIKRRRKAAAEQQAHAAEKALKKKLRITPPKYDDGKTEFYPNPQITYDISDLNENEISNGHSSEGTYYMYSARDPEKLKINEDNIRPAFADKAVAYERFYNSAFNYLDQRQTVLDPNKQWFDKNSKWFGSKKGYTALDKLFKTNKYKNIRDQFYDDKINKPQFINDWKLLFLGQDFDPQNSFDKRLLGLGNSDSFTGASGVYYPEYNIIGAESMNVYNPIEAIGTLIHEGAHSRYTRNSYNPVFDKVSKYSKKYLQNNIEHDEYLDDPDEINSRWIQLIAENNLPVNNINVDDVYDKIQKGLVHDNELFNRYGIKGMKKIHKATYDKGKTLQ